MSANRYLIADNLMELEILQKARPELAEASAILLSANFDIARLDSMMKGRYYYFDERITEDEVWEMSGIIHKNLWTWFKDESGKDLSAIDGCSLGRTFATSIEMMLNSVLRYKFGLKKFLEPDSEIYYVSNTEDIFLIMIKELQKEVGFKTHVIGSNKSQRSATHSKYKIKTDPISRKRDLEYIFYKKRWGELFMSLFLRPFQFPRDDRTSILIMPAGKLEGYFDFLKSGGGSNNIRYILPLSRKDLKNVLFNKDVAFFRFHSFGRKKTAEIDDIISNLKRNLIRRVKDIDPAALISVMDRHTFRYFYGAYSYYIDVVEQLKRLRPNLFLSCAVAYESYALIAQAAKMLGIVTAHIPNGIYEWGYREYKSGKDRLFDYCMAFGNKDVMDYKKEGVEDSRIYISVFPHFSKFLPVKKRIEREYKRALVLAFDFTNVFPGEKIGGGAEFIRSVARLLRELGIDIKAVKARYLYNFQNLGIDKKHIEYDSFKIPLIYGYSSFPEAAKDVDLVIGPVSTAMMEAGLMGIDYYMVDYCKTEKDRPSIPRSIYDITNVAASIEELKENIVTRKIYRSGRSVRDLVDMSGMNTAEDLYLKLERSMLDAIRKGAQCF